MADYDDMAEYDDEEIGDEGQLGLFQETTEVTMAEVWRDLFNDDGTGMMGPLLGILSKVWQNPRFNGGVNLGESAQMILSELRKEIRRMGMDMETEVIPSSDEDLLKVFASLFHDFAEFFEDMAMEAGTPDSDYQRYD